ncbi:hypothetical protein STEG23_006943, partial [Scotinomys teguina]
SNWKPVRKPDCLWSARRRGSHENTGVTVKRRLKYINVNNVLKIKQDEYGK